MVLSELGETENKNHEEGEGDPSQRGEEGDLEGGVFLSFNLKKKLKCKLSVGAESNLCGCKEK